MSGTLSHRETFYANDGDNTDSHTTPVHGYYDGTTSHHEPEKTGTHLGIFPGDVHPYTNIREHSTTPRDQHNSSNGYTSDVYIGATSGNSGEIPYNLQEPMINNHQLHNTACDQPALDGDVCVSDGFMGPFATEKYLFYLKTNEGFIFKHISEIMQISVKNLYLDLKHNGVQMQTLDLSENLLFHMVLNAANFQSYFIDESYADTQIGVTLKYFYTILKSIKKKDKIELFIEKSNCNNLGIRVCSETRKYCTSYVKMHSVQNIIVMLPQGYGNPIVMCTIDYHKMCKEVNEISNKVRIETTESDLKFTTKMDNIYSKCVVFKQQSVNTQHQLLNKSKHVTSTYDTLCKKNKPKKAKTSEKTARGPKHKTPSSDLTTNTYLKPNHVPVTLWASDEPLPLTPHSAYFAADRLLKVIKLTGLAKYMQVFFYPNLPLFFKISVGSLGVLHVYIKADE